MAKKPKTPKGEAAKRPSGGPKAENAPVAPETPRGPKEKPMLRAIRVTPEVLEAAKAYKKATGVSFYALGLESISDRLAKEGFLKKA